MKLRIEQHVRHQFKYTPRDSVRKDGAPLAELLDFLTAAQAHGIPDGACVIVGGISNGLQSIDVYWVEEH